MLIFSNFVISITQPFWNMIQCSVGSRVKISQYIQPNDTSSTLGFCYISFRYDRFTTNNNVKMKQGTSNMYVIFFSMHIQQSNFTLFPIHWIFPSHLLNCLSKQSKFSIYECPLGLQYIHYKIKMVADNKCVSRNHQVNIM